MRVDYFASLSTEAVIVSKGDVVYSPEIEGTASEKTDSRIINVYQGRLVKKSGDALRRAKSAGLIIPLASGDVPAFLKKTLDHEIGRLEEGKEARLLSFSRFILPWDLCGIVEAAAEKPRKQKFRKPKAEQSEAKSVPKKPKAAKKPSSGDISKRGLRLLALIAKKGGSS